jgi:tetratricopeptide (TPR) repeat protein
MHTPKSTVLLCLTTLLFGAVGLILAQAGQAPDADLLKAIDSLVAGKTEDAIPLLEKAAAAAPSEQIYLWLGKAYIDDKKPELALSMFQKGVAAFPTSARLWYMIGQMYEANMDPANAIPAYHRASVLDPPIVYTNSGRYDPDFDALYLPVVHDHRGANSCVGRLYVTNDKMHFVVYHVVSGWGQGNDDSFETPYSNISNVEVDRKSGTQWNDYSILTLLTNQSGTRRRIGTGEEARIDLKFTFDSPIHGYRGKPWDKNDIKFFFIEPENGEKLLKFLETKGVKTQLRNEK